MKLNKRLTSYPILISGDDDYIDSYFDVKTSQNIEFGEIKVKIDFSMNNEGLVQLIKEKKISYVIHFECPLLSYRKIVMTDKLTADYSISLDEVANTVEISTFIVATQDISKYYNEKFNWEYGTEGVDIDKGNILAIGPTYTIKIDRSKDGLKKLSDIISIKQYKQGNKGESTVVLEGNVILIYVNEDIKNKYYVHGRQYLYNIISMIMVPAMVYILTCMKYNKSDLEDYRWFTTIEQLLKQNNVEISQLRDDESSGKYSIFELAQKIFKSPLEKGIIELSKERGD